MFETFKKFAQFGARLLVLYINLIVAFFSALSEQLEELFLDD